jgi:hypothetical protein
MNRVGNSVHGGKLQITSASDGFAGDSSAVSLIYDRAGNRKYLTSNERRRFLDAVETMPAELRTFWHRL